MNDEQRNVRRNELRTRYGKALLPRDVLRCNTTCFDSMNCYAAGCEFARDMAAVGMEPAGHDPETGRFRRSVDERGDTTPRQSNEAS